MAVALLVLGVAGCARTRTYTSATLPAGFRAPLVENAQAVDIGNLVPPPANNDLIDCGDVLKVSLAAGLDADAVTNFFVRVGDDGTALLPEIGQLPLAGLHLMQAEQQIATACVQRSLYRRPHVTVTMERQRTNRIMVAGAVEEPGIHELPRGSSYLSAAIMAAGGLAEDAGTKVEIRRPAAPRRLASRETLHGGASGVQWASNEQIAPENRAGVICLNLADPAGQARSDQYLDDGSVVTIERRIPQPVEVVGLVRKPGRCEFPVNHDLRVFGAIAESGGLSSNMADKVLVLRTSPDSGELAVIQISLSAAKKNAAENLRLAPGDIVSVEQTPLTMISDTLNKVIRFGMSATVPMF